MTQRRQAESEFPGDYVIKFLIKGFLKVLSSFSALLDTNRSSVKEPVKDGGVCHDHCQSDKSKDEHVHIQLRSVFGLCSCLVHQRMRTAAFSSPTHDQICDNDQW